MLSLQWWPHEPSIHQPIHHIHHLWHQEVILFVSSATLTIVPFVLHACRSLHSIFNYAVARVWLIATAFRLPVVLLFAATACGILCRAGFVVCDPRCNSQLGVVLLCIKDMDFWLWHIQLQQHGHCFQLHFVHVLHSVKCAAHIKAIQGKLTFVCFKEVAIKIPVIEGTNDMVLYFSQLHHHIGHNGTWLRFVNQGYYQGGVRNFLIFVIVRLSSPAITLMCS